MDKLSRISQIIRKRTVRRSSDIRHRFIARVLTVPFVLLVCLGIIALVQINFFVKQQAIENLSGAAQSTAAKLEREIAIRQSVLKRTGEEMFSIKGDYNSARQKLENNRAACAVHYKQKKTFQGSPEGVCNQFLVKMTGGGGLIELEKSYVEIGTELIEKQNNSINDRLAAYKQFFPETVAILVVDSSKQLFSSAASENVSDHKKAYMPDAIQALTSPVVGKFVDDSKNRFAIFGYPISNGSVTAVYDVANDNFLKETWKSTPLNRTQSLVFILDSKGNAVYPNYQVGEEFKKIHQKLRDSTTSEVTLKGIEHIAVGSEAGESKWMVVVGSPSAAVLAPTRDAQLAAYIVIGLVLLGFLWVGAFFVHQTVRSILGLVAGALVFSGNKLDYRINLGKADKEFVQLADTMNLMAERIATAEKLIDEKNKEFISVATHELRTPLTAIIGNLSLLREDFRDKFDPSVHPIVDQVNISVIRLRDLINDMLDVARMEGGKAEFFIVEQDITLLVKDVIDSLKITATQNNLSIHYDHNATLIVLADPAKLRIIMNNFVSNAIKYNRPGGTVTVSHEVKDTMLVTSVADTGLGIPDDQKKQMFEKFFRVQHQDRQNVTGTGLGMYITRQYVLAMGGELWFESAHGEGTIFHFSLPMTKPESFIGTQSKV